ncbi:MAG TPA: YciI family protein [Candidatus Limnocylindrales bacterium]|nr:YciI family protein [Candidatus Limnocylindrales bacterium]
MRYLMLVAVDPDHTAEDEARAPSIEGWVDQVTASGAWVMGERLRPTSDATTVRVRGGKLLVTDGPYTESKEWIAGFDILDCADLDAAIEIAAQHPMAYTGRLELRPFWPFDEG